MLELTAVPLYTLPESFRHRGKPSLGRDDAARKENAFIS